MRHREGGGEQDEGREAPERDDEAEQEQDVVDALEDVPDAGDEEAQRRLMPARIEAHEAGVAVQLEGAHVPARRQEAQGRRHPLAEAVDARMHGEGGALGADRILEQHVEELLAPVEVELLREARAVEVGTRRLVGNEGAVGRQRHARGGDPRRRQAAIVLVNLDMVDQPELGRVAQGRVSARQVEVTGAAGRHVDVAHGGHRHAHEELEPLSDRLDEQVDRHVRRHFVRAGAGREDKRGETGKGGERAAEAIAMS